MNPSEAFKKGIFDAVVAKSELLPRAISNVRCSPKAVAAWDKFVAPDAVRKTNEHVQLSLMGREKVGRDKHQSTAIAKIQTCVNQGLRMSIDDALALETRLFVECMAEPHTQEMLHSLFTKRQKPS